MCTEQATPATYNGWANYETWVAHLWLTNDQGTDEIAREIVATHYGNDADAPRIYAADQLAAWVEDEVVPDLGASLAADVLMHAFRRIDWLEIVDALHEDEQ